ncbi:ribosome maturation factor RimM [Acuticoccus sp. I52.16.1]|uniref:ribosome maturation factor RimM n=1 Tax=Acuticoccus sp. I52.16.1 TaxID=2928472 RepID=UPI001FD0D49C|nr:ribosome maturation factor RimM [Acuticoccus sp. I52.16.1]UOM35921.1 ribosome maturation factor RimM [Acuticoccus sp. I52.16.1]
MTDVPKADGPAAGDPAEGILMATIGAPHGVRGAVKLTVFAEDPLSLRRYNPFTTADGRSMKLTSVKPIGKAIVATIDGIDDRNAAETLRGTALHVARARLPRPDEDEFYHVDLIGLEARLEDGTPLGTVRGVFDFGAGDLLDILGDKPLLVPFTREVVPHVDLAGGVVTVAAVPGLLDDPAPEDGADADATPEETAGEAKGEAKA